jgi:hypothetical protein
LRSAFYQTLILLFAGHFCAAQSTGNLPDNTLNLPSTFFAKIQKKYTSIQASLERKTAKYLRKMERQEKRMQRKAPADSGRMAQTNIDSIYTAFRLGLQDKKPTGKKVNLSQYNAFADTMTTSFAFLRQYPGLSDKAKLPAEALEKLKRRLNASQKIKEFMAQRKEQMREALAKYTHIPASLKNQYDALSKSCFYYSANVKKYRDMVSDPQKIEKKALGLLTQMPLFQKFMKENSQLASLFGMPTGSGEAGIQNLAGLQSRSSVQQIIQQRIASGGPNAMAMIQQNLVAAQAQMSKLKDKLSQLGGGGDLEMPGAKINQQKTHSFFGRLEYTANVQFEKSTALLPTAALIGIGAGYRIDDLRTLGIGLDYSLGLGTLRHISFNSLGVGARTYFDWKIKNQLYFSGGYEMHYNSAFKNISELKNYDAWQVSALAGLSKKYKISKKLKGNFQISYDFLASMHQPVTSPFLIRCGYTF